MSESTLTDFPLSPSQIISGTPITKIFVVAQSEDKKMTQGLWDSTAGQFSWDYSWDESVYILEGEATVTTSDGQTLDVKAGDLTYFPKGIQTVWNVASYVKKTFVIRTPEPLVL